MYEVHAAPQLHQPVLLMFLQGWIDAGTGADLAVDAIKGQIPTAPLVTFDDDALIDYRSRRPTMHLETGVNTGLTWPSIEMRYGQDGVGNDVILLTGSEPDRHWRTFASAVADLAERFDVTRVLGLGAYPAPTPHTRDVRLASSATTRELADDIGHTADALDVPAGVHAAIELAVAERGIPSATVWAGVPHYVAASPYPGASAALVEGVVRLTGLALDASTLHDAHGATLTRIAELVDDNPQAQELVEALEEHVDTLDAVDRTDLPTGDELADAFRQLLDDN